MHYATELLLNMQKREGYHNADHALKVVNHVRAAARKLDLPRDISLNLEIAAAGHDVVYEPLASFDSVLLSAALTRGLVRGFFFDEERSDEIANLIRVTKHDLRPSSIEEAVIADADLAILGSGEEVYVEYAYAVRDEYLALGVNDFEWLKGRKEFLASMLRRKTLFYSAPFAHNERPARQNLFNEFCSLREL